METIPQELGQTILYKFRSLNSKEKIEQVRDILINHRLYCATAESFNDPFEFQARISCEAPKEIKIEQAIKRIRKENPSITEEKTRRLTPSRIFECERNGPERIKSHFQKNIGIVSLAGTLNNILMWSHYADGHKGISIEFKASNDEHLDFFGNAVPVDYSNQLPTIYFYTDDEIIQARKFIAKSDVWGYEKEFRILNFERDKNKYYIFDPALISKIYLGLQISDDHIKKIKSFISQMPDNHRPILLKAKRSISTYSLDFTEID
ncbi:MAG: DUF2971 domain-containing protein [Sedimentisphaerales bacterium]|nr:DUF2971 domain-containing protein [Sedimentisphaerales bacterium]